MTTYKSDIVQGDEYEDTLTGMKGIVTAVTFYIHACERATIEFMKDGELKYETFDAPRLRHIESGKQPEAQKTGGPGGREARQHQPSLR